MALRVDSTPPQSFGSAFELRGGPDAGELRLASPLGNTLATVVWSPAGAELRQGSQVTRRGTLDDLTAELGGAPLPVAALFAWLRGQPASAAGWNADLSQHADGRITARRESPAPTAELRLVFEAAPNPPPEPVIRIASPLAARLVRRERCTGRRLARGGGPGPRGGDPGLDGRASVLRPCPRPGARAPAGAP